MRRLSFLLMVLALIVGVSGCEVTVTNTPVGSVADDGSVYLGWTLISHRKDKGSMSVGKQHGQFSSLRFAVKKRVLNIHRLVVHFGNGEKWSPQLRPHFPAGAWSRDIDLPGGKRFIRKVVVFGKSAGKRGRMAKFELYGRR